MNCIVHARECVCGVVPVWCAVDGARVLGGVGTHVAWLRSIRALAGYVCLHRRWESRHLLKLLPLGTCATSANAPSKARRRCRQRVGEQLRWPPNFRLLKSSAVN